MVTVCTVLPPPERPRIDAAGDGCFNTLHAESLREALAVVRRRRVDAVVISVHLCHGEGLPGVARFVREFPAIPAVALVSRHDREATETLLRLGATGVRTAVDCTEPDGWRRLRDLVGHPASPVAARVLARITPALDQATEEVRLFFEAVARLAPALSTVRALARHLRVRPSTLMSRFHRAGMPSPKSYLAGMRLLHASFLFQNPGLSVSDVAYRMDYSSPQSFGRHLRAVLGVTAGEFRRRFPFDVALARYIDLLITPYRETLRAFYPFNAGSWDQGPNGAVVSRLGRAFSLPRAESRARALSARAEAPRNARCRRAAARPAARAAATSPSIRPWTRSAPRSPLPSDWRYQRTLSRSSRLAGAIVPAAPTGLLGCARLQPSR